MTSPPFAIVIPCYNDGKYLPEALASVAACDPSLYELLIVNDGSTDPQTLQYLQQLEKDGFRVLHQENKGLAAARNAGIAATRAPYILPLDSDNKLRPEYLSQSLDVFRNDSRVSVVYGDKWLFGYKSGLEPIPEPDLYLLIQTNYIDACAPYRRSLWVELCGYDEGMRDFQGWEDWDFWLRAMCLGHGFHHIDQALFDYRLRSDSMAHDLTKNNTNLIALDYLRNKRIQIPVSTLVSLGDHWSWAKGQFKKNPLQMLGVLIRSLFGNKDKQKRHQT